jgi:two-component system chemotaxis sensor kinase CheA
LLHDVLRLTGQDRENLDLWLRAIFEGALDFGSLRDLGPRHYAHTAGRFIRLDFYPIQDGERVHRVVMVATDETEQRTAKLALEQERGQARMILKAVRARQQFGQFLDHLRAVIDQEMTRGELKVEESFRTLHTIEGEAGLFSVQFARDHARKTQEVLEPARSGWVNDDTALRQQFRSSIESFKEHFEEFLIEQRELLESLDIVSGPKCEISREWAERFAERLRRENKDLYTIFRQEALSESLWRRLAPYSDLVSGLAEKLGKNVELRFDGEDIKVESKDYQGFLDSLVHVFRNAVDHGMETPEERECSGKPNVGRIHVKMLMERRDQVEGLAMEIKDDGRGVDIDKVRIKLAEKFPSTDWMRAPREDVLRGLFLPGFSSLDSVGEFSGRGVGLDAVKSAVESLGGSVEIFSEWERGTTFRFWLPQREALRQVV